MDTTPRDGGDLPATGALVWSAEPAPGVEARNRVLAELDAAQGRYEDASLARSSRRAYASSLERFTAWCQGLGLSPYPADGETVARYAVFLARAGKRVSTIDRTLAAIRYLHLFGPDPDVADPTAAPRVIRTMRGIRREHGAPPHKKRALSASDIVRMVEALDPATSVGVRDRALLMFGYAAGVRRGELAGLERGDLADDPDGLRAMLRRAKGDTEHTGQLIGVAFGPTEQLCPVRALRAWLEVSPYPSGSVFRPIDRHGNIGARGLTGEGVASILKRHARAAGLDPATVAGHSLRSGHATGAARAGEDLVRIQKQLRHRQLDTTAGYVQTADVVRESSSRHLWDEVARDGGHSPAADTSGPG